MDYSAENIMNSGRRDKVEIMAAIVAMTQKPAKITHIMNRVNLGHGVLKDYLELMIGIRMIEKQSPTEGLRKVSYICQATDKGLRFLKVYCELLRLMYGKDFSKHNDNLAIACLQYCKEDEKHTARKRPGAQ